MLLNANYKYEAYAYKVTSTLTTTMLYTFVNLSYYSNYLFNAPVMITALW